MPNRRTLEIGRCGNRIGLVWLPTMTQEEPEKTTPSLEDGQPEITVIGDRIDIVDRDNINPNNN